MGLTDRLRSWSLARPHVLVLAAPGAGQLRCAVEVELGRRGWPMVLAPADADLVVLVGALGPELGAAAERLWQQVPAPRSRVTVSAAEDAAGALDAAAADLVDWAAQRQAASALSAHDPQEDLQPAGAGHQGHDMDGHEGPEMGGGREGHEMGGMEHGMHHDMGAVAGLPMAMTGEDRDGLQLDVLGVSLGPFLPGWPPGLVVEVSLSGDVVTEAKARFVDDGDGPRSTDLPPAAAAAQRLADVLLVAGWAAAGAAAAQARNELVHAGEVRPASRRWLRRVQRSRVLGWALRGTASHEGSDAAGRVRAWCDVVLNANPALTVQASGPPAIDVVDVGPLLEGMELGAARLGVATLLIAAPARVAM